MICSALHGVTFITANTDIQALNKSKAEFKIQLGDKLTKGLGAGANPDCGRDAALESIDQIRKSICESDMVFVTAGMGGRHGATGAAPVIAQAAKEAGALTVGVVTKPFYFEGQKRRKAAEKGIAALSEVVWTPSSPSPNDRLLTLASKKATFLEMLKKADEVLFYAVKGHFRPDHGPGPDQPGLRRRQGRDERDGPGHDGLRRGLVARTAPRKPPRRPSPAPCWKT